MSPVTGAESVDLSALLAWTRVNPYVAGDGENLSMLTDDLVVRIMDGVPATDKAVHFEYPSPTP
jgi:hypothetical protein